MDSNSSSSIWEEAFLLCSLHEVLKIWSNGTGKASFNLDICDGEADLKLSFKLGAPSDVHYQPQGGMHVNHHQQFQDHHDHLRGNPQKQKRRRKGPARREKDRARAAAYQARYQPKPAAAAPVSDKLDAADPAAIKLPFYGSILLIKKNPESSVESSASPQSSSFLPEASSAPSREFSDVAPEQIESVKKQLFTSTFQLPHSSSTRPSPNHGGYQQKEKELWSKLFKSWR